MRRDHSASFLQALSALAVQMRQTARVGGSALVLRAARRLHHQSVIAVAYPPSADPVPRFGHGRPCHPELEAEFEALVPTMREELNTFEPHLASLERVPADSPGLLRWRQIWIPALDAVAIHSYLLSRRPASYVEIGSGTSTAFAHHAKTSGAQETQLISIDPEPRGDVEALCDVVVRRPFELCSGLLEELVRPGDVLFFDGSHQVFTNSDTVTFFFEVLPRLPAGVLVGIHDIFLPASYPPDWTERYYAEQYVLGAYLLGGARAIRVRLAAYFAARHPTLRSLVAQLTSAAVGKGAVPGGQAFWFETVKTEEAFRAEWGMKQESQ